ncbi:hypothetical protein C4D60_Mb08t28080 [Musa balbisiana]|uniref:Uncharacterized protein n=1 Tax=Musa balbisiana TaxID=52838 RepID=A0A4V4H996_MUSBA|nr:hypothetical protein C4D60_Mb08t28080 [Musa balbisiana]
MGTTTNLLVFLHSRRTIDESINGRGQLSRFPNRLPKASEWEARDGERRIQLSDDGSSSTEMRKEIEGQKKGGAHGSAPRTVASRCLRGISRDAVTCRGGALPAADRRRPRFSAYAARDGLTNSWAIHFVR